MNALDYLNANGPSLAVDISAGIGKSAEETYGELIALESLDLAKVVITWLGETKSTRKCERYWEATYRHERHSRPDHCRVCNV
jgi:hypothetical protein